MQNDSEDENDLVESDIFAEQEQISLPEIPEPPKEKKKKKKPKEIFDEKHIKASVLVYLDDPTIQRYHEIVLDCVPLMDYVIADFDLRNTSCESCDLQNELIVKLPQILEDFRTKRGRLFSYLLICFKNYLTSFVSKLGTRKHNSLPENADDMFCNEDFAVDNSAYLEDETLKKLKHIPVRNVDSESIQVFEYYCKVLANGMIEDKARCNYTAHLLMNLSVSCCSFLYDCFMHSLKISLLTEHIEKLDVLDLMKIREVESMLPEIANVIGESNTIKLITLFGGSTLKFPKIEQYKKLQNELEIYKKIDCNRSERNIEKISRIYGVPKTKIKKIHVSMGKIVGITPKMLANVSVSL